MHLTPQSVALLIQNPNNPTAAIIAFAILFNIFTMISSESGLRLRYTYRRHHPSGRKCRSRAISYLAGSLVSPLRGAICEASAQLD